MITELRRIAQGLDQMHDLDARIMAIYERGRADERARVVAKLQKLADKAVEKNHSIAAFHLETAAFVIEAGGGA